MAITWSDVLAISEGDTSLATLSGSSTAAILLMVDHQIDDTVWGTLADDGRKYLAAHMGAIAAGSNSSPGTVLSETLGPMARSYNAALGLSKDKLATTKYGLFYLHLISLLPTALGLVS